MTQGRAAVRPAVEFATGQAVIKGEDIIFVRPRISFPKHTKRPRKLALNSTSSISDSASSVHLGASELHTSVPSQTPANHSPTAREARGSLDGSDCFGLFCVFDGHNGVAAAQHVADTIQPTLEERLPAGIPPAEDDEPRYTLWREQIQRALVEAFCDINEAFACKGQLAGATVTVVVQCGWLVTVANVGDSRALLDTGSEVMQVTVDHRIATHQGDRKRLEGLGARIAPIDASGSGPAIDTFGYGPLRVWPGGLCLSRGIGDFDVGPPVIACPHIYQFTVPESGARLIIASDGVWDGFENMKRLGRMSRNWSTQVAPNKVIQAIQRAYSGLRDDTSLVVLDIMPPGTTFGQVVASAPRRTRSGGSSGSGCFCFSPAQEPEDEEEEKVATPGKPIIHIDLDVAAAVGLMPGISVDNKPAWCTEAFSKVISQSQVDACRAWNEARSMRSMGKTPSRQELASFFSAVHNLRPLGDTIDPHDLDISTRPPLSRIQLDDVTVHPRSGSRKSMAEAAAAASTAEGADVLTGDASTRFKEHVAVDQKSYARNFGHYKDRISLDLGASEIGSTSEDDSMRAGAEAPSEDGPPGLASWKKLAEEAGWQPPQEQQQQQHQQQLQSPPSAETPPSDRVRGGSSLYSLDSAMTGSDKRDEALHGLEGHPSPDRIDEVCKSAHSGRGVLPTVAEDEVVRSKSLEDRMEALPPLDKGVPSAVETTVRRGRNRFTPGGKLVSQASPPTPNSAKPPRPSAPRAPSTVF